MSGLVGIGIAARSLAGRAAANAKRDWAAIPPKVRLAILGAIAAIALFFLHQHYAHRALSAADKAGYDRARAEDAAALKVLRERAQAAETKGKAISQDTRSKNDETRRNIAADADALRVRGPGAASCRPIDHPAVPAAGSEPRPGSDQQANAARSEVPAANGSADLAAVPWLWLVGRAEQCDLDRAEAVAWRSWYQQQSLAWEQLRGGKAVKP